MGEQYCGVKFRTIFKSRTFVTDKRLDDLISWCKEFNRMGFTPSLGAPCGNLSFRSEKGFVISCSKAVFSDIEKEDFVEVIGVEVDKKEIHVRGAKEPSAESFLHNAIYSHRKDVNAVFHGHSRDFIENWDKLSLTITQNEQPGGSIELMNEVLKVLEGNNFIIMKNHGFLSLGDTMGAAGNLAVKRYNQLQRVKRL